MRAGVLIVGGGVMGASVALSAARRRDPLGSPVVLLERRGLGAGSSGRSGAILRQFHGERELIGMARDSLREYARFEAHTGRAIGFTRCGVLTLAASDAPEQLARLERVIETMRECGVEVERVDARAMRELVPGLVVGDEARGAWEPAGGSVDPQRTIDAFAAVARSCGATTRTGVEVRGFIVRGARVVALETSDGVVEAEQVVVAAGPWTRALLARAAVELPLRAVRSEHAFLAMPPAPRGRSSADSSLAPDAELDARFARADEPAPAHAALFDLESGYSALCEPLLGRTRVSALERGRASSLDDPEALDARVSAEFQGVARAALEARLPFYREQRDRGAETLWHAATPDALALIGLCPGFENLFVVSGCAGRGFELAPSIGAGVAQMLDGDPVGAFDPRPFAPARFESGATEAGSVVGGLAAEDASGA